MAVSSRAVTVTTTATRLDTVDDTTDSIAGQSIALRASSANTVDVTLGASDVVAGSGFPLAAGEQVSADLMTGDHIYGRVPSGTAVVYVLESGV